MCGRTDIILLLDASAQLFESNPNNPTVNGRNDNWSIGVDYLIRMLQRIPVSPSGTHIGVIIFDDRASVEIRLSDLADVNQIAATLRPIRVSLFRTYLYWLR